MSLETPDNGHNGSTIMDSRVKVVERLKSRLLLVVGNRVVTLLRTAVSGYKPTRSSADADSCNM